MRTISTERAKALGRRGERGAALITTLLVATLLLSVGGALIFTAAMAGVNASDSTTEMQAYYGAEAGLQAAVNILRGNVAGTKATFRNIADNPSMSNWVAYNATANDGTQVVRVSDVGSPFTAYNIRVIDPDSTPAADEPLRLLIQVRGYGPRGAVKNKEMIVHRFLYDPDVPAAITMVGAQTGTSMVAADFDIGDSNAKGYTGSDNHGSTTIKATFGFTQAADKTIADNFFASSSKAQDTADDTPRAKLLGNSDLPKWLRSADKTRTFLSDVEELAIDQDRRFTASPAKGNFGSAANPVLTFVDGDCELNDDGAGMLVVTGKLTLKGDFNYDGVVLVIGQGSIERNGGGGGKLLGGLVVAALDRNTPGGEFLAKPTFNTNGGGNSDIKYDSKFVEDAFTQLGPSVKGVREF
ncbi:MAG TPA: hypothetical protein VJT74_02265 [Pyrinomonadaceae bacterium]|nr:hypothetical protein [Pyrinomonadaceae bacterium]